MGHHSSTWLASTGRPGEGPGPACVPQATASADTGAPRVRAHLARLGSGLTRLAISENTGLPEVFKAVSLKVRT
jgi:hypothetical protein